MRPMGEIPSSGSRLSKKKERTIVPDYLFLFKGGLPSDSGLSPEEMQQHIQKWFSWIAALRDKGIYKGGEPLEKGGLIVTSDQTITDGPFAESKELIGGYVMVDVDTLEEAAEIAKECPVLELDGRVEVRPVALIEEHCPSPAH